MLAAWGWYDLPLIYTRLPGCDQYTLALPHMFALLGLHDKEISTGLLA